MSNALKTFRWNYLYSAILAIVLGILFIAVPEEFANIICIICGIALIALGAAFAFVFVKDKCINSFAIVASVVLIILGIFCIADSTVITAILGVVVGLMIVCDSMTSIYESVLLYRFNIPGWPIMMAVSVLCLILGIISVFTSQALMVFCGISLIIDGVVDLVIAFLFTKKIRTAKRRFQKATIVIEEDEQQQ